MLCNIYTGSSSDDKENPFDKNAVLPPKMMSFRHLLEDLSLGDNQDNSLHPQRRGTVHLCQHKL